MYESTTATLDKKLLLLLDPGACVLQKTELLAKVFLREGLVVKTMEN